MDIAAVMDLIVKGLGVVNTLVTVGSDALPAIKVLTDLATGAQNGDVTDEQLAQTEATLDALVDKFNAPL